MKRHLQNAWATAVMWTRCHTCRHFRVSVIDGMGGPYLYDTCLACKKRWPTPGDSGWTS